MNDNLKIILDGIKSDMYRMRDDTQNINKCILYLCGKAKSMNERLRNIEADLIFNNEKTNKCIEKMNFF